MEVVARRSDSIPSRSALSKWQLDIRGDMRISRTLTELTPLFFDASAICQACWEAKLRMKVAMTPMITCEPRGSPTTLLSIPIQKPVSSTLPGFSITNAGRVESLEKFHNNPNAITRMHCVDSVPRVTTQYSCDPSLLDDSRCDLRYELGP